MLTLLYKQIKNATLYFKTGLFNETRMKIKLSTFSYISTSNLRNQVANIIV
jgi:hypothetical protein